VRGPAGVWSIAREGLQTIAWSSMAGLLVWRGVTARRVWVRAIGGALLASAVLRLVHLLLTAAPPDYLIAVNARVLASLATIAIVNGLACVYRGADVEERRFAFPAVLWILANTLTLTLFTS